MSAAAECARRGYHAWTWKRDSGPAQVCDDCGAERRGVTAREELERQLLDAAREVVRVATVDANASRRELTPEVDALGEAVEAIEAAEVLEEVVEDAARRLDREELRKIAEVTGVALQDLVVVPAGRVHVTASGMRKLVERRQRAAWQYEADGLPQVDAREMAERDHPGARLTVGVARYELTDAGRAARREDAEGDG